MGIEAESSGSSSPACAVFLSYASEDRAAAEEISTALRAAGIDVWFDANELRGGDAWDDLIRQRIKDCTFFVALISPHTQARAEGYFRREWKLAIERSLDMAEDRPFILPVTLTAIAHQSARVPRAFVELQWTHLPEGKQAEKLVERLQVLHCRVQRTPPPGKPGSLLLPTTARRRAAPARRWRVTAAVFAVLAGALAWGVWRFFPGGSLSTVRPGAPAAAVAVLDPHGVAVLPFTNVGNDAGLDYLCDGVSEELLNALGRENTLRIVARTSSFAFRGRRMTAQQIATQLGVGTLVEGTVRHEDDVLKFAVRLVAGATGYQLWSHDYVSSRRDLQETEAVLAADVATQLLPVGSRSTPARPATRNLDAYDAFLRARSFQAKPSIQPNLEQAASYYRQATEADPGFALAWARYGAALIRLHTSGFDDSDPTLQIARQAIARALELAPDLPDAHYALANYYTMNWTNQELATAELVRARQAAPNDPDILVSAAANDVNRGKKAQAVECIRQAALLDPENGDTANIAGWVLDYASIYADAVTERERAFRLGGWNLSIVEKAFVYRNWKGDLGLTQKTLQTIEPARSGDNAADLYWRVRVGLARAQRDWPAALAGLDHIQAELLPREHDYLTKSYLRGLILEAMGDAAGAHVAFEQSRAEMEQYRDVHPLIARAYPALAIAYAALGREADARAAVAKCLELIPPSDNPYVAARAGLRALVQIEARTGHWAAALRIVREQVEAGFWKRYDLLLDPDFEGIRQNAEFAAIAHEAPL